MAIDKERSPVKDRVATLNEQYVILLDGYFGGLDMDNRPSDEDIGGDILNMLQEHVRGCNRVAGKDGQREKVPGEIPPNLVARVIMRLYHTVMIDFSGDGFSGDCVLGIYDKDEGLYMVDDRFINSIVCDISPNISDSCLRIVMRHLNSKSPVVRPCYEPRLVAVANGIFDLEEKKLLPFTSDLVFTSKCAVAYNPSAEDVHIPQADGTEWTVDGWFKSIHSNPEVSFFLWQVLGMLLRPNYPWDRMVFLYSESGSNGKGTFCQLARNILGPSSCASIRLADFGKPFALEKLLRASAVIADENDVGEFVESLSFLKAMVTGDTIQVDRKYKGAVNLKFNGLVVQCINGFPQVKDQSESFLRRLVLVKMDQTFTGKENKAIKSDYIYRQDVLEYITRKLLEMDLTEETLKIPACTEEMKDEYREFNNPVWAFWQEFKSVFVWDLLPYTFLYDLFKKWFAERNPSAKVIAYKRFLTALKEIASADGWECDDRSTNTKSAGRMDEPERLIIDWQLENWMDRNYRGDDWRKQVMFEKVRCYRGVSRLS